MKITLATLLGVITMLVSCENKEEIDNEVPSAAQVEAQIPKSFSEAMRALDARYTAKEKAAFLKQAANNKDPFTTDEEKSLFVGKIMGMQLRNDWGLWKNSLLKQYFEDRGIAHADWISSALFEGWEAHLRSGTVDEAVIIAKYAAIEKRWRKRQAEEDKK